MSVFLGKMLLATDGSPESTRAARMAVALSETLGSELHVVHVLPRFPRHAYPGAAPEIYSYLIEKTYEWLATCWTNRRGASRVVVGASPKAT